jgi:hypothetical protein
MNNGEDLLVQLLGDDEDCLWVTQPYRVELMPSVTTMTVTTSIMRWIPFESLMTEKICINKSNVLTYLMVDPETTAASWLSADALISKPTEVKRKNKPKPAMQAQLTKAAVRCK